jgi:hypothetical protein
MPNFGGDNKVVAIIVLSLLAVLLCSLINAFLIVLRERLALQAQLEEEVAEEDEAGITR